MPTMVTEKKRKKASIALNQRPKKPSGKPKVYNSSTSEMTKLRIAIMISLRFFWGDSHGKMILVEADLCVCPFALAVGRFFWERDGFCFMDFGRKEAGSLKKYYAKIGEIFF
jgi:hypothetical protein